MAFEQEGHGLISVSPLLDASIFERYAEGCDSRSISRFGLLRESDAAFGEEDVFFCVKSVREGERAQRSAERPRRLARNAAP